MEFTAIELVLVAALALGVLALVLIWRRIKSWSRGSVLAVLVCCAFYGSLPYILLKGGVLVGTPNLRFLAGSFFIIFTLLGTFALNFTVERQNLRGSGRPNL